MRLMVHVFKRFRMACITHLMPIAFLNLAENWRTPPVYFSRQLYGEHLTNNTNIIGVRGAVATSTVFNRVNTGSHLDIGSNPIEVFRDR